jgi:hypothetical protein
MVPRFSSLGGIAALGAVMGGAFGDAEVAPGANDSVRAGKFVSRASFAFVSHQCTDNGGIVNSPARSAINAIL